MEMTSYAVLFCDPNSDVRKEDGPVCRKSGLLTTILLFYSVDLSVLIPPSCQ